MTLKSILVGAALAVSAACTLAGPLSDADTGTLVEAAQVPVAVKAVHAGMVASFRQAVEAARPTDDAQRAQVLGQFERAFDLQALTRDVTLAVQRSIDPSEFTALMRWYGSPVGRRIASLDVEDAANAAGAEAVQRGMDALIEAGPARGALYKRYVAATGNAELTADFLLVTTKMAATVAERFRPGSGQSAAAIDANFARLRPSIVAQITASSLARAAWRYRGLSDDDLQQLIEFEASPAEQKLVRALLGGLAAGLKAGLERMGDASRAIEGKPAECEAEPDDA